MELSESALIQIPNALILVDEEEEKLEAKEEKKEEPEPEVLSEEDQMRMAYMQELEEANIIDLELKSKLNTMMDMGYFNYKVNYNLLLRNKKDVVVAVNNLCNGMVSESML